MRCEYPLCRRKHHLPIHGVFLGEDHFPIRMDILDRMTFDPCFPHLKTLIASYREGILSGKVDEMDMFTAVMKYLNGKDI